MECNNPDFFLEALPADYGEDASDWREEVLSRHSDRESTGLDEATLEEHIRSCPACRTLWAKYDAANRLAEERGLAVRICPSTEDLDRYAFRREEFEPTLLKHLGDHIRRCELCANEVAWLRFQSTHQERDLRPVGRRVFLAAAAAIVLAVLSFLGARAYLRVPEGRDIVDLATVPVVDPVSLDSLPELGDPGDRARYREAETLVQQSRIEDASARLASLAEKSPLQPKILFLLGTCYSREGRWEDAYRTIKQTRICPPLSVVRCWYLANLCLKMRDRESAEVELEHVLSLDPNHTGARTLREKLGKI